jgi:putative lipoic acid-binding regulatory protein
MTGEGGNGSGPARGRRAESADGGGGGAGAGASRLQVGGEGRLDESEMEAALELAHTFPGYFPVVVIARHEPTFESRLVEIIVAIQDGAPHTLRRRASRHGSYMSYRIEIHVESARQALSRRNRLSEVEGVVMLL